MAKWSSQHNGKFPDPYAKLVLDEEKKHKKKKKKKDKNRDRDSILSQLDPNVTNKVRQTFFLYRSKYLIDLQRRCDLIKKMSF